MPKNNHQRSEIVKFSSREIDPVHTQFRLSVVVNYNGQERLEINIFG